MNEEEKFDELLSSKLSERDFPFDELNWDDAERLLIQQERRAKITRVALTFAAGLTAGVLIMLPFILNTHSPLPNTQVTKSAAGQNPVAQNNILPPANTSQVTINNTTSKKEEAPLPVQSAFVKKDTRTGIRSTHSNISSSITKTSKEQKSILVADINTPRQTNKLQANSNVTASAEKKSEYAQTINRKETNPAEEASNASSQPITTPVVENATQSNNIPKTEKTVSTDAPVATNNTSSNTPIPNNTPGKSNPPNTTALNNTVIPPTTTSAIPKIKNDSGTTNIPPPPLLPGTTPNYVHSDDYSKNILSAYAGGNYSFGWTDNGDKEANGITPLGGFNFTHYFAENISACLGIGYSELTNLNKTYTSSMMQYDFGANASVTTVTPQTVYYIAFPLKLQYNLDSKNMFGIGLNYLLMLTTSSTLTTYQQSYFSETTPTSIKQNGYTQGFSNSDMQLTLSYTRMLTGRFGISAEYYYDFNYVENNTIPGINQSAKNMGLRLILSYQLMK